MRERSSQLVLLAFVLVFMAWILCAGLVVSAQNTNSSTTMVPETSKPKPKHRKAAAQTTGRCDPMQQEQTDLSGTYTGKATHSDGSVSNDVTLTVTGNNFTLTGGPEAMSGRITAVTTCGYTAVTMMSGDMTPPAAGAMAAAHTAVSLRAKKVGDRLTLTSVTGEPRKVSFVSAGAAAKAPRKHRRKARDGGGTEESVEFPWPPPRASASVTIPYEFLKKPDGQTNLRDVSGRLTRVLNQAGYEEMSWYEVPSPHYS